MQIRNQGTSFGALQVRKSVKGHEGVSEYLQLMTGFARKVKTQSGEDLFVYPNKEAENDAIAYLEMMAGKAWTQIVKQVMN